MRHTVPNTTTRTHYEIISVTPCTGYQAVWADECEGKPRRYRLRAEPLHLLGVARATEKTWQIVGKQSIQVGDHAQYNAVVALAAIEGAIEVCNEFNNFAGICREGENIYDATGELPGDIRAALDRPERREPATRSTIQ